MYFIHLFPFYFALFVSFTAPGYINFKFNFSRIPKMYLTYYYNQFLLLVRSHPVYRWISSYLIFVERLFAFSFLLDSLAVFLRQPLCMCISDANANRTEKPSRNQFKQWIFSDIQTIIIKIIAINIFHFHR